MDEKDYKLSPEDRKLLAKDLYQRLGTGTLVQDMEHKSNRPITIWLVDTLMEEVRLFADEPWQPIDSVRPYLRPMASMTEEEKEELFQLMGNGTDIERIDFYVSHRFDFRGLIPKGLALEAKEGMYGKE